ncbi:unnamed protein product, partial [marine sediment metagenome]
PFISNNNKDFGSLSIFCYKIINNYRVEYDAEICRMHYYPRYPSRLSATFAFGDYSSCIEANRKYDWNLDEVKKFKLISNQLNRVVKVNMEMTNDKMLFLTILYILKDAREEFVKETYQNLVLCLNLENARKFNDVFNWFKEDKIKITSQNRIEFSHPSYFEAMKDLISEGDDYDEIFIILLKYLAGKEETVRDVVSAIIDNFDKLPENIRQILFTLAKKDEAAGVVAFAIIDSFDELPEDVREQLLLTLAENDEAAGGVAFAIAENF